MLPRAHRMRKPGDFRRVLRARKAAGTALLVVYCRRSGDGEGGRVGFVVPKRAVRLATQRNRVKRQLRHLMCERVAGLPADADVVVRVRAGAVGRDSDELAAALDGALERALRKASAPSAARGGARHGRPRVRAHGGVGM